MQVSESIFFILVISIRKVSVSLIMGRESEEGVRQGAAAGTNLFGESFSKKYHLQ